MIVVCGNCDTRFQLDDARVPDAGIRVRCSRCKTAFFLRHPSVSDDEAVDAIAEEAMVTSGTPGLTQDLPIAGASTEPFPSEAEAEDEESDWEFNDDDFGGGEPDANEESRVFEEAPGGLDPAASEAPSGLEIDMRAGSDPSVPEIGISIDDASSADPSWLGGDGDDAVPPSEPPTAAPSPARETEPDDDDPFGQVDDFSSFADPADDPSQAPAGETAPAATSVMQDGDLDDPEEWDFFSDESLAATRPSPAAAPLGGAAMSAPAAEVDSDSFDLPAAPSAVSSASDASAQFGRMVGWGVTLVLLLAGTINGLLLENPMLAAGPEVVALGTLEARGLEGRWVERARGGSIYVVRGELHNPGQKGAVPGAALRIALAPQERSVEALATAVAGFQLSQRDLRELRWDALQVKQMRASSALSWSPIEAGAAVPFAAVFEDVPPEAARFHLEVAPATRVAPSPQRAPARPPPAASPAAGSSDGSGASPVGSAPGPGQPVS